MPGRTNDGSTLPRQVVLLTKHLGDHFQTQSVRLW
jgi:hypothetical protein